MKREQIVALLAKRGITVTDAHTDEQLIEMLERAMAKDPAPDPAKTAVEAERKRCADIKTAVRAAKLTDEFAETLITEGKTIDEARALIIEEFAKNDPHKGTRSTVTTTGPDEVEKKREAIAIGIAARVMPEHFEAKDQAREYRGMKLIDIARVVLEDSGKSTRGMTHDEIAKEALGLRSGAGMMSTSDFPIALANTAHRTLRKAYELQEQTFTPFVRLVPATDFKTIERDQIGEGGKLKEVAEGGEYEYATMGEAKEVYKIKKYGKIYAITWEAIVNDDLDVFGRIPRNIAAAVAANRGDLVYGILTGNPNMGDGVALFHADHKNLVSSGTAIDVDSLTLMRKKMRTQKALDGKLTLNLAPKFLVVAPELEGRAYQYTSPQYTPATPGTINPQFNQKLITIVEDRLSALNSGLSWFGVADPNLIDTIELASLNGEAYTVDSRVGFDVDGVEIKVRATAGVKAIDWRAFQKNVGA